MGRKHSNYCSNCRCLNCRVCNSTIEECINLFNNDVGNSGWVNARGRFHKLLREKFQNSNYDCSGFIKRKELPSGKLILTTNMRKKIRIDGMKIVQIND